MVTIRFVIFLLVTSFWFVLVCAFAAILSLYLPGPGIYGTILLALVWGSSFYFKGKLGVLVNFWVILFSGISCFSVHYHFADWYRLNFGKTIRLEDLNDISKYPEATKFEFFNALARKDISSKETTFMSSNAGGFSDANYHSIALTSKNWKNGDEIGAWLTEKTGYNKNSFGIDRIPIKFAVSALGYSQYYHQRAISRVVEEQKVNVPTGFRMLRQVNSIEQAVNDKNKYFISLSVVPYFLVVLAATIGLVLGNFKHEPEQIESSEDYVRRVEAKLIKDGKLP